MTIKVLEELFYLLGKKKRIIVIVNKLSSMIFQVLRICVCIKEVVIALINFSGNVRAEFFSVSFLRKSLNNLSKKRALGEIVCVVAHLKSKSL